MTPAVKAFVEVLIDRFEKRISDLLFLQDLLKMPCCGSLTVKMQNQVAAAIQVPYEQLKAELGKQDQLFMAG